MSKYLTIYLCTAIASLAFLGCGNRAIVKSTNSVQSADKPAWPEQEMIAQAFRDIPSNAELKILLWKIMQDDRPVYSESCITHIAWHEGVDKWRLAHLYRHRIEQNLHGKWAVHVILGVPHLGKRDYAHKPTEEDMDRFLKNTWWRFRPSIGFKLIDAGINSSSWKSCFGSSPPFNLTESLRQAREGI
jgi:hypothetical protein